MTDCKGGGGRYTERQMARMMSKSMVMQTMGPMPMAMSMAMSMARSTQTYALGVTLLQHANITL